MITTNIMEIIAIGTDVLMYCWNLDLEIVEYILVRIFNTP